MATLLILVLILASSALAVHFWRKHRRLALELLAARARIGELESLGALLHDTNYQLACKAYGQAAVERSIREANKEVC